MVEGALSVGNEVVVFLFDGRVIDISGLSPSDAIDRLKAAGVQRPSEIRQTVHRIPRRSLQQQQVRR